MRAILFLIVLCMNVFTAFPSHADPVCDSISGTFADFLSQQKGFNDDTNSARKAKQRTIAEATEASLIQACESNQKHALVGSTSSLIASVKSTCYQKCTAGFSNDYRQDALELCQNTCNGFQAKMSEAALKQPASPTQVSTQTQNANGQTVNAVNPVSLGQNPVPATVKAQATAVKFESFAARSTAEDQAAEVQAAKVTPISISNDLSCATETKNQPLQNTINALSGKVESQNIKDAKFVMRVTTAWTEQLKDGQAELPLPGNPNCGVVLSQTGGQEKNEFILETTKAVASIAGMDKILSQTRQKAYVDVPVQYVPIKTTDTPDRLVIELRAKYIGVDEAQQKITIYCNKKDGKEPTIADFNSSSAADNHLRIFSVLSSKREPANSH